MFGPGSRALSRCRSFPFVTSWAWRSSSRWHRTITDGIHPRHRGRSRRRVAGDAPPRLLLRDPRGIHAADGVSHHYPFAFSLPVDFYDVGLHSVIVGDEDSDVAHVPFIVQMVTLDED
jgi:hypothetical protein